MTGAGELRHRLTLEQPVDTPDDAGGVLRSFAPVGSLWAKVTAVSARDAIVADASGATVTHRIVVRARTGLTTRHRLRDGGRTFSILALRELGRDRAFIEISAAERVA